MLLLTLGASCIATAAPAATVVQYDSEQGASSGFAGFDARLGTLQSVTLAIAITKSRVWQLSVPSGSTVPATIDWKIDGNWLFGSNNPALGKPMVALTGAGSSVVALNRVDDGRAFGFFQVTATGGTTLTLDPAQFVGRPSYFNGFDLGHNGNVGDTRFPGTAALPAGYTLTQLGGSCFVSGGNPSGSFGEDFCGRANYTLTYNYAAVPEPASWTLMLAGFAATGVAVRRRRRVLAA